MIRVDQAGEFGARQIYLGQLAVLRDTKDGPQIQEMYESELKHLHTFNRLMVEHRARPTALSPLWGLLGYGVGVGSALLGREAAMACTVAVETVIGEHYNEQLRELDELQQETGYENEELRAYIREFRDEELEHLEIGLENDAERMPLYDTFTRAVKVGALASIWLAKRI